MALLPKVHSDFSKKTYWDNFFSKRGKQAFEWYGDYRELEAILCKYIKINDQILLPGCGNSQLSADLYDVGYTNISNIDISERVIKTMKKKNEKIRPNMEWKVMNVFQMEFEDEKFNVVLDKGTLDAIMPDNSEEVRRNVEKMFEEISRVTKLGGRFICVSLLQIHILQMLLEWFGKASWMIRIHACQNSSDEKSSQEKIFPVFIVVCTKLKKITGMTKILEFGIGESVKRVENETELIDNIENLQHFMFVRHELTTKKKNDYKNLSFELHAPGIKSWRYNLYLTINQELMKPSMASTPFAIFIVPQGRECEWLYGTDKGRLHLARSTKCRTLIVVHLSREHSYENLNSVKDELSSRVMELAPSDLPAKYQIPFWSNGEDLGKRQVLEESVSEISGGYVVEDVEVDSHKFRRLIFLSNRNVIQSEAKLIMGHGKKKQRVNLNFLACDHHTAMVQGLAFLPEDLIEKCQILLVGLGGGGLAMYMHKNLPKITTSVVDIDPTVVQIATKWFNFAADDRLKVQIEDGIVFLDKAFKSGVNFDVIMLDVDGKDSSVGMSCPPEVFVSEENLKKVRKLLNLKGLLILNLVCRDITLKENVLSKIGKIFSSVYYTEIEEEVNNVVYCLPYEINREAVSNHLKITMKKLKNQICKEASNHWNIEEALKNLSLS